MIVVFSVLDKKKKLELYLFDSEFYSLVDFRVSIKIIPGISTD